MKAMKVLFVCLGNICRSPAAEEILRSMTAGLSPEWSVDSAGTGRYHIGELPDRRMRVHALQRGYTLTHHCRLVTTEDFEDFDLIVGMDASILTWLRHAAPSVEAARKIRPMASFFSPGARYDHVPDPYYEGSEGFELVLDLLEDGCRNIIKEAGEE
ncbi:MAG: low molecular weight phosphotyrosine protein phosphatase [Duncaniella sp.]|nr:low molecular weight phosphotyrosine protein phosphatase [Duncaniella sp.]